MENLSFMHSGVISGIDVHTVRIEATGRESAHPRLTIIGVPDADAGELRVMVEMALASIGWDIDRDVVVNCAPSSLAKSGASQLALPIALSVADCCGRLPTATREQLERHMLVGTIDQFGHIGRTKGTIAYEAFGGYGIITGPGTPGIYEHVFCLESLTALKEHGFDAVYKASERYDYSMTGYSVDFTSIEGYNGIKQEMAVAAVGGHGLLLQGSKGAPNQWLARAFATILPDLDLAKRCQIAEIYSVCGLEEYVGAIMAGRPQIRVPHYSASRAGLFGGGSPVTPGEVTLAAGGVLVLEDIDQFSPSTLQLLRQPLETGQIGLARAHGTVTLPADFRLVATAPLSPDRSVAAAGPIPNSTDEIDRLTRYQERLGGPIQDKLTMRLTVPPIPPEAEGGAAYHNLSSQELRDWVAEGIAFREEREAFNQEKDSPQNITRTLTATAYGNLEDISDRYRFSGQDMLRTMAVARSWADLFSEAQVLPEHLELAAKWCAGPNQLLPGVDDLGHEAAHDKKVDRPTPVTEADGYNFQPRSLEERGRQFALAEKEQPGNESAREQRRIERAAWSTGIPAEQWRTESRLPHGGKYV